MPHSSAVVRPTITTGTPVVRKRVVLIARGYSSHEGKADHPTRTSMCRSAIGWWNRARRRSPGRVSGASWRRVHPSRHRSRPRIRSTGRDSRLFRLEETDRSEAVRIWRRRRDSPSPSPASSSPAAPSVVPLFQPPMECTGRPIVAVADGFPLELRRELGAEQPDLGASPDARSQAGNWPCFATWRALAATCRASRARAARRGPTACGGTSIARAGRPSRPVHP